ncbi:hypothetical protein M0802_003186 [Mischocyttarus mexicanus]|nr:hypothetical protein M0802_003186 [Mischocyttarus mexicanus]
MLSNVVIGQLLLVFLSLFLIDDVSSGSFEDTRTYEINRFNDGDWPDLSLEEPLRPVKNHFWRGPTNLGHISGVSVDLSGFPVVFHRADRIWGFL